MSSGDVTIGFLKRLTNYADILAGQEKFDVEITGGDISNVTLTNVTIASLDAPLPITAGGTGSITATAARTALGLEIGVNVQAYNVALLSIAGLTTAADKGVYTTASNVYATFDLTAAGRALMDDATAADQRTTLGLGSLAIKSTINNDDWSGTDLSSANGGTGLSAIGAANTVLRVNSGGSALEYSTLDAINITDGVITNAKLVDGTIENAKLADMAAATIKGRQSGGGTGAPEDLTATQARGAIDVYSTTQSDALVVDAQQIPQNSQSAAYTLVLGDAGGHIYHPSADTTARIWTIPANASVAYPIGTAVTFANDTSGGVITIAITTDTLVLAGAGTTGSRTLAANGMATALKITATRWIISGSGLT